MEWDADFAAFVEEVSQDDRVFKADRGMAAAYAATLSDPIKWSASLGGSCSSSPAGQRSRSR